MKKLFFQIVALCLRYYAQAVLAVKKPQIIAITGSVAKSTTKEAVYSVLKEKFGKKVGKSEGNLNTEIGVPLAILRFRKSPPSYFLPAILPVALAKLLLVLLSSQYPKILILELAADKPGDIAYFRKFIHPRVAIITLIGPAHLAAFKTQEAVAKEKGRLIEGLDNSDVVLLNQLDPWSTSLRQRTKAKVVYFVPKNNNIPFAVASLVGKIFQLSPQEIEKGREKMKFLPGRMNIVKGKNESIIIDDAYNANPLSVEFALNYLVDYCKKHSLKRKIVVLGDMLELGDYSKTAHQSVGKKAAEKADILLATGSYGKIIAEAGGGQYFETKEQLIQFLQKIVKKGDIILIKASRKMKFEEIVSALTKS